MGKSYWLKNQGGNYSNEKNDTFDESKDYIGIRLQQGVPLLDRDINELEDLRRYQDMNLRRHYVGDGTPDKGFEISKIEADLLDFKIGKGRYLVDGIEAICREEITYKKQTNVPALNAATGPRKDLVYIELTILEVDGPKNSQDAEVETCKRQQIQWKVLVNENSENLPPADPFKWRTRIALLERDKDAMNIKDLRSHNGGFNRDVGDLTVKGVLTVNKAANLHDTLEAEKDAKFNSAISVDGKATLNGELSVSGKTVLNKGLEAKDVVKFFDSLTVGTYQKDASITLYGLSKLNGTAYIEGAIRTPGSPPTRRPLRFGVSPSDSSIYTRDGDPYDKKSTLLGLEMRYGHGGDLYYPICEFSRGPDGNKAEFWGNVVVHGKVLPDSYSSDLAESLFSEMDLSPGDVVCLNASDGTMVLSSKLNDPRVAGVISASVATLSLGRELNESSEFLQIKSNKKVLKILEDKADKGLMSQELLNKFREGKGSLNEYKPYLQGLDIPESNQKSFSLALSGSVLCKVVNENGSIQPGDLLTTSSTPGHAMKANPVEINGVEIYRPGTIIGKAITPLKSAKGTVTMLVMRS